MLHSIKIMCLFHVMTEILFILVILRVQIKWPMDTVVEDLLTYPHVRDYHTHPLSQSSLFVPMHLSTQKIHLLCVCVGPEGSKLSVR